MSRLIDADKLIEKARTEIDGFDVPTNITLKSLPLDIIIEWLVGKIPTVDVEPKWIPVSEGLPKVRDWYLAIFKEADTGWVNPIPFVSDYLGRKTKNTTNDGWIIRDCTDGDVVYEYYRNLECVAWMPLPEPYKEKQDE